MSTLVVVVAQGSLGTTLKEVRPTAFLGVPRVWEKMQEKMREIGKNVTGMKKRIATWAKDVGYRGSISKMKRSVHVPLLTDHYLTLVP